jgi:3D (Asp-Asp-Asp) domain-containing protein
MTKANKRKRARIVDNILRNIKTVIVVLVISSLFISVFLNYWFQRSLNIKTVEYNELEEIHSIYVKENEEEDKKQVEKIDELTAKTESMISGYADNLNYEVVTVTAYSDNDPDSIQGTTNTTSIGFKTDAEYMNYINIVAVDPDVIPYGTIIFILFGDGIERKFIAGDTGYLVKGRTLDILITDRLREQLFPDSGLTNKDAAIQFGTQALPIRVSRPNDTKIIEDVQ